MTAEEIRQLREQLGCSVGELAKAVGVDTRDILGWESGATFPTKKHADKLRKLAEQGQGAIPRRQKPAPESPYGALADARVWKILRKLLAHPTLLREVERMAEQYDDPVK